jgi:hypothetical protein
VSEKKVKFQMPGQAAPVDAVEVAVAESTERWSEVHLEDGTVLRLKPVVVGAIRVDGQYDQDGNPVYSLKVNQIMIVGSAPEHLRKGGSPATKKEVH